MSLLDVAPERVYLGVCPEGHRSYLRLRILGDLGERDIFGACKHPGCDKPAKVLRLA
jgi:hypothetical protein